MMGRRQKTADPQFQTHVAYVDNVAVEQDLNIIENVTEYDVEIVWQALGPAFQVSSLKLDPRVLGLGCARARVYIVAIKHSKLRWVDGFTLTDFVDSITSQVALGSGDYWWKSLPAQKLSSAEETWLHPPDPKAQLMILSKVKK